MAVISSDLAQLAAQRHGVLHVDEMTSAGIGQHARRHLVRCGALVPVHRTVVRVASSPDTFEARCVAACLASDAVVTGLAAAALWRFRHVQRPDVPIVLLPHSSHSLANGAVVRRTNSLHHDETVRRPDGIVVAAPARTWFDCARDVSDASFEAITEWVLDHHCSPPTLWATVRRLGGRGRSGAARVRRVMSQRSDWQRPAGSRLELDVLEGLRRRGVPELVRQHPIRLENGIVIHPDGADLSLRWAIEVDHVTWHGGRHDAQRDKQRDRWLRRVDWVVERVTDQEMRERPHETLDDLAASYFHHRRRTPSPPRRAS